MTEVRLQVVALRGDGTVLRRSRIVTIAIPPGTRRATRGPRRPRRRDADAVARADAVAIADALRPEGAPARRPGAIG